MFAFFVVYLHNCSAYLTFRATNSTILNFNGIVRLSFKGTCSGLGQCLFTEIVLIEILIDFFQKVIHKCTYHFGKD